MTDVKHSPWLRRTAAIGFIAKGAVYAIIGVYAIALAAGHGGGFLGTEEATREVKRQPFGDVLLVALAIGFACHALWRFVEAALAPHDGDGAAKSLGKRVGAAGSGLFATLLSITTLQHLAGRSHARGSWLQRVMRWDGGDWLIVAVGAGFVAVAMYQLYKAVTWKFREQLKTGEMSAGERRWLLRIGRAGIAARAVVMGVGGWLLIKAGLDVNAQQATGVGAALREIAGRTYGMALLAIVAAGLIAYAVFMGVHARYRRVFA